MALYQTPFPIPERAASLPPMKKVLQMHLPKIAYNFNAIVVLLLLLLECVHKND